MWAVLSAPNVTRYKHTKRPLEGLKQACGSRVRTIRACGGAWRCFYIYIWYNTLSVYFMYVWQGGIRWILGVFFSHTRQVRPWYLIYYELLYSTSLGELVITLTALKGLLGYTTKPPNLKVNLKKEPQHVSARHLRSSRREALAGSRMQSQVSDQSGLSDRGEPRQGRGRVAPKCSESST